MRGSKTDRPLFKTFCVIFICIYQLFPINICIAFHLNKYFDFSLLLVFLQVKLNPSCLRPFCQFIQPPYSMSALGGLCLLIGHIIVQCARHVYAKLKKYMDFNCLWLPPWHCWKSADERWTLWNKLFLPSPWLYNSQVPQPLLLVNDNVSETWPDRNWPLQQQYYNSVHLWLISQLGQLHCCNFNQCAQLWSLFICACIL